MLYDIPDKVKNNIFILLNKLANKGINLDEVKAIYEIGEILNTPVKKLQPESNKQENK